MPLLACPGSGVHSPRVPPNSKRKGCIWYYTGWRTGNRSNSKGCKGQWKNSEPFEREIKVFYSSPLVLQSYMITCKSQQSSYKILRGRAHREGHLFCWILAARKGTKQHGLPWKALTAFQIRTSSPQTLNNPNLNLASAGQPCKASKKSKRRLTPIPDAMSIPFTTQNTGSSLVTYCSYIFR